MNTYDEVASELVPKGHYRARAVAGSAQLSRSETGSEYIVVSFEIIDDHAKGQQLAWFGYFSEKTEERTLESLRLAGWSNDDIDDIKGLGDTEVDIEVEHKEWKGKVTARVAWVNRPGTGIKVKSPMSSADKKAFAAKLKGKAILSRQGKGNSAPPKKVATDDDIPF